MQAAPAPWFSTLSDDDLLRLAEGTHFDLHDKLGSRLVEVDGVRGAYFAVLAPDAVSVSVVGDFNGWNRDAFQLHSRGSSGVWEGFVPGVEKGACYKYFIRSRLDGWEGEKADPFAIHAETPGTASKVWDLDYAWNDDEWMRTRGARNALNAPISIYEVHLGSWMHVPEEGNRWLDYREIAHRLAEYVQRMNFTHVEILPVMEHPYYGSWGYQTTGYFAPTSRYGTPQDFMYFVDTMHACGIGVILDWVPAHFPLDDHGLAMFDGSHLYEHANPQQGYHPEWRTAVFNYGRKEVRAFLASSALSWFDRYHADGIRADAVSSMLYLDYSREEGEWVPNENGGRENLDAVSFLRELNAEVYRRHPGVQTFAEESTSWPGVSRPLDTGGLGFGLKWDLGWMHDTRKYFEEDPLDRKSHHDKLSFWMTYAWGENFLLPLSHDEVVHGKGTLLENMPGDEWQRFANLRALFGLMYGRPGKKLLFMGCEIGQWKEWNHEASIDWDLLDHPMHEGVRRWIEDLNRAYRDTPALHQRDCDPAGFEWIDSEDSDRSLLSFVRYAENGDAVLVVANFTPVPRLDDRVGVPRPGLWKEILNSDAESYGGGGIGNPGGVEAETIEARGRPNSIRIALPPLGVLFFHNTEAESRG